ncbi:MAG: LysM peptidoglycan-binding domain-containing protein [Chloroflexota bacterium]|nr:LysM peptidoglycan-binding domain-containing protein [Chloroflexota bacterium]MBI5703868.1 LysM peptidoglycan-binding domain-containing protein [Chloroflexota bacterium]
MLNRTPPNKPPSTSNIIQSYRKKRMQRGSFLLYGAIALVVIGLVLVVVWLMGPDQPLGQMFATETPTATVTFTPTSTNTPTMTPTATETPTITFTPTPSEPFDYVIQEGDTLPALAERFNLGPDGVLLILDYNPTIMENNGVYFIGQTLKIPPPGTVRATSTPIPANLPRGTKLKYTVLPGDTLAAIAAKFNSKTEDIITANKLEDANALQVGQVLEIPVNLVTATPTLPPTSTPVTPTVLGQTPQAVALTPAPGGAACSPVTNEAFVSDLLKLINDARTAAGLPALTVNPKLSAAANAHAKDMLCNNYLSPLGLDGSTVQTRVAAQGYTASVVVENLYALHPAFGMSPRVAFDWWNRNEAYRSNILNPNVTEIGIAYVADEKTLFGAYFVVTFAKP